MLRHLFHIVIVFGTASSLLSASTLSTYVSLGASLPDASCLAQTSGASHASVVMPAGSSVNPTCSSGFWTDDNASASASFLALSTSVPRTNVGDFYVLVSNSSFEDALTVAGFGSGLIRFRFVGEFSFHAMGFSSRVELGTVRIDDSPALHGRYEAFTGSTDYWTAFQPFAFGSPFTFGASLRTQIVAMQGTIEGSAALRLAGIEVTDANGKLLGAVLAASDSGTDYSTLFVVPEPSMFSVGGVGLASLFAVARRRIKNGPCSDEDFEKSRLG